MDDKTIGRLIGILGGSFDPVHCGHLRFAIEAVELLELTAVHLVPLCSPNHREPPIANAEQRLAMLRSACEDAQLYVDEREIARGGISYMVETLVSMREEFGDTSLCLLLGADAFAGLCTWHQWQDLLSLCHIVVVTRPGASPRLEPRLQQLVQSAGITEPDILRGEPCGRIFFQAIPLLPISSTDIRQRIANGQNISYLVPRAVQQLIDQHQLYR